MPSEFQRFVISQVAILIRDGKCLILEDAARPGKWILPGGRMDIGEKSEPAFRRELLEELGIEKFENSGVVDFDIWYPGGYSDNSGVCGLAFLINCPDQEIVLSSEHLQAKWTTLAELDNYDFIWPNAKRMIQRGFKSFK